MLFERVMNRPPAVVLGVLFIAFALFKQTSVLNLSQNLISVHASLDYDAPITIEAEEHGTPLGQKLKVAKGMDRGVELLFPEKHNARHDDNIVMERSMKEARAKLTERILPPISATKQPETAPAAKKLPQQTSEEPEEPEDEPILQDNPDDDRVEIWLDETGDEPEKPYQALKMIEEAVANAAKLAKEMAYNKYSVPPPKPMLDESVPFSQFSHIHYVGIAGLGHRLVRHAAAVYIGRRMGFAVRGYWSNRNDFSNGTKDLFLELFDPFTREEFAFVNSTNRTVRFANGVFGMKGPAQHCSSSRQARVCRQRNSRGIECETCGCTNDEIQVHYDFYMALRNKYTRRHLVSAFMEKHNFASHTVIGIHIRAGNGEGRDFTFKKRGIHHGPKEYVSALIKVIRNTLPLDSLQKPPLLFLATDQSNYRDLVADEVANNKNLSWPVVFLDQEFSKSGVVLYGHGKYKEKWHSMFQDMALLSHSDVLIATQYSSFTQSLPMSLVLGRPASERNVHDGYCEVIDENDDGTNGGGPDLHLYCYNSYMQNCCGTSNKVHRKVTKFLYPGLRTRPILNVTVEDFYPRQYFSFEDSLGRFVWNVSRDESFT